LDDGLELHVCLFVSSKEYLLVSLQIIGHLTRVVRLRLARTAQKIIDALSLKVAICLLNVLDLRRGFNNLLKVILQALNPFLSLFILTIN
jgi:hypothetical protein